MKKFKYIFGGFLTAIILLSFTTSYAQLRILRGSEGGTNIGSATAGEIGNCLKILSVSPLVWETGTCGSGGGGGTGFWTRFNNSGIYPATSTDAVVIGHTATTTDSRLEVNGTTTSNIFTATSTSATSTLPLLSSTFSNIGTLTLTNPLGLTYGGNGASNALTLITTNGNITAMPIATNYIRYTPTSTTNIQGIANDGTARRIYIESQGTGITLIHESASATAANRITLSGARDFAIPVGWTVSLEYNTTESRWRLAEFRPVVSEFNTSTTKTLFWTASGPFTGTNSVVLGNEALATNNISCNTCVLIGYRVAKNSAATLNGATVVGQNSALVLEGTSQGSAIFGQNNAQLLTTGVNYFFGQNIGNLATTATNNFGAGGSVFTTLSTGANNIALLGGVNVTSGSSNIFLGSSSGFTSSGVGNSTNSVGIGASVRVAGSNQMVLGGNSNGGTAMSVLINSTDSTYRVNVGGDVNLTAGSVYRINGVAQTPWSLIGNAGTSAGTNFIGTTDYVDLQLKTNNTLVQVLTADGLSGFQKATPTAIGHFGTKTGTISAPTSLSLGIGNLLSSGGYSFGSGNKDYSIYAHKTVSGTAIYSTALSGTFTEPSSSDLNPTSGSANSTPGSGYDPNVDTPPTYEVYALFAADGAQSPGTTGSFQTDNGTWVDTGQNQNVNVSWSAGSLGSPSNYYVVKNGSEYRIVSGSFTDDNTGWAGGSSPGLSTPTYDVSVSFTGSNGAEDYTYFNTSTTKYTINAATGLTDDDTWTAGTPVTTPTSASYTSLISDGIAYFADKVGVGTSTPWKNFSVSGTSIITGTTTIGYGDGRATINGTSYDHKLSVADDDANQHAALLIERNATSCPFGCGIHGVRSRGDRTSKSIVQADDALLSIFASGYDGTDYATAGAIRFWSDGTPGSNDMPGRITFLTSADGSQTLTERMTIKNNGFVGIATTTPWATLSASGTVALANLSTATGGTNHDLCINSTTFEVVRETTGTCIVSSKRFKHDIEKLDIKGLDVVDNLIPSTFVKNGEEKTRYGFISEEVSGVNKFLATYEPTGEPRGLDDHAFLAVIVKAIQELKELVFGNDEKIKELEARIELLENKLKICYFNG